MNLRMVEARQKAQELAHRILAEIPFSGRYILRYRGVPNTSGREYNIDFYVVPGPSGVVVYPDGTALETAGTGVIFRRDPYGKLVDRIRVPNVPTTHLFFSDDEVNKIPELRRFIWGGFDPRDTAPGIMGGTFKYGGPEVGCFNPDSLKRLQAIAGVKT